MKNISKSILILFMMMLMLPYKGFADSQNIIYKIDVNGEVNKGMYHYIKESIDEANKENADYILLDIDTYGGRVDSAVDISDIIIEQDTPTIAYINKKAESAGVLISISCDYIYMNNYSTIGSAETIPNTEKNISYWTSQLKAVAEQKGRNPEIVAAMADKDIKIEKLVDKGKLLNLTTKKAHEIGFIDGIASSMKQIYTDLNIENYVQKDANIKIMGIFRNLITSSYVAPLLLSLGFIGMILEILTPGFGFGGIISIVGFSLFFLGSVYTGNSTTTTVFVFGIGIILLVIEAMAPGFGIFGTIGIGSIIFSIIMASSNMVQAFLSIMISLIVSVVALIYILKKLPKRKMYKTLFLNTTLDAEKGYIPSKDNRIYLNKEGITISYLRPSGKIEIDGEILDVITEGIFIGVGQKVRVVKIESNKIIVRHIKEG
ncbi:NfeD family protein [Tepidibacter aestuarii]|uniref:NfeD family protein n=1 Tax=Tepidibacter aestuarii TaxID=2925782 RepID=UPI0020C03C2D|nr:NfeD family protein [Tepidibacter aestuarii]CAH2214121.1 membrane-bound serine protease (ClpP class) [Tepidibacter aestuarii]